MHRIRQILKKAGSESGFTLLELITVIVVVGIITGVVSVSVESVNEDTRLSNAATRALSDIRYAQEMAMTHRRAVNVVVNAGGNSYSAVWADNNEYLKSPADGGDLNVTFGSGEYQDVSISSGLSGTLGFLPTGQPTLNGSLITDTYGRSIMRLNSRLYLTFYGSGLITMEQTVGGGGCSSC